MHKKSLGLVSLAVTSALFFGTIALANIISGLSTTNVSSDVTITQLTLTKPSDATIGDLLLANIAVNGGSPAGINAPTGWALISRSDNDTNVSIASYYRIVGSTESTTYTWSISPQTHAVGGITRYSGIDATNPIDIVGTSSGRGITATAPSVSTTVANNQVVSLFASNVGKNNSPLFSTTSGMTKKYDAKNAPFGPTTSVQDAMTTSVGLTGTHTVTISNNKDQDWTAQTIALRMRVDVVENFEGYGNGAILTGLNGGMGWTSSWNQNHQYGIDFIVQNTTASQGTNAVKYSHPYNEQDRAKRTFAGKTIGTIHWSQMKDSYDSAQGIVLYSGSTPVASVYQDTVVDPLGAVWVIDNTRAIIPIVGYTTGLFDTADLQFDSNTDKFRVSINRGPYTDWMDFISPTSNVDTIELTIGAAGGSGTINNYWDDINITGQ